MNFHKLLKNRIQAFMKDLLILYPHGLGDCILLTPAIKSIVKEQATKTCCDFGKV